MFFAKILFDQSITYSNIPPFPSGKLKFKNTQTYQFVHLKCVYFIVCKVCLKKTRKKFETGKQKHLNGIMIDELND